MAKEKGKKGGERKRGTHTYNAFDGWSGVVLRVLVDVGDDFAAVGARCCVMLVVREERVKQSTIKLKILFV